MSRNEGIRQIYSKTGKFKIASHLIEMCSLERLNRHRI